MRLKDILAAIFGITLIISLIALLYVGLVVPPHAGSFILIFFGLYFFSFGMGAILDVRNTIDGMIISFTIIGLVALLAGIYDYTHNEIFTKDWVVGIHTIEIGE